MTLASSMGDHDSVTGEDGQVCILWMDGSYGEGDERPMASGPRLLAEGSNSDPEPHGGNNRSHPARRNVPIGALPQN